MKPNPIRIGSRGSQLALWQANHISYALRDAGFETEIEIIRTTGDRMQQPGFVPPPNLDGKGIFIKEIEEALEDGRIDLAVHSLKDLPTKLSPQFEIAAIPKRADPRDVFVCEQFWALHTLPSGAKIGTTSPRRQAQILALRPDVIFVDIRGNIDTRLKKLESGKCDALVLAAAGLDRLKRAEWVHQRFDPTEMCPAPGQGALALETRSGSTERDLYIRQTISFFNHPPTRFSVEAERTVLDQLGGGCQLPIGALCIPTSEGFTMHAQVVAPDGETMIQLETQASSSADPIELGQRVADHLQERGALDLLANMAAKAEAS
jgi:hydroxymethylbilane synthase